MHSTKAFTWLEYLAELQSKDYNPDATGIDISGFLRPNNPHPIFQHSVPVVYLLDYTTCRYHYLSESTDKILGVNRRNFIENGVDYFINNYHKDDLKIFNERIFPERVEFLRSIPPEEHKNYIFSYNYRIRRTDGSYCSLLQRNSFVLSDKQGNPLLSLGMVINVEHYKNPNTVVQLIEKAGDPTGELPSEPILKKIYTLKEEDSLLTRREREVLRWMADGMSSKQIAEKLFLSEHTVIVHRKNMLAKTNSSNVAQLLAWAMKNEVI